ncbi:hypothetical protein KDL44_03310 [bacterium]|nr:hypothetical protein [bacterium]
MTGTQRGLSVISLDRDGQLRWKWQLPELRFSLAGLALDSQGNLYVQQSGMLSMFSAQ